MNVTFFFRTRKKSWIYQKFRNCIEYFGFGFLSRFTRYGQRVLLSTKLESLHGTLAFILVSSEAFFTSYTALPNHDVERPGDLAMCPSTIRVRKPFQYFLNESTSWPVHEPSFMVVSKKLTIKVKIQTSLLGIEPRLRSNKLLMQLSQIN